MGIIRKVFDDIIKRCLFVEARTGSVVKFSVKLIDMKHFIDFAS